MVSSKECPENHPIYVVDIDMSSSIFFNSSKPPPSLLMIDPKGGTVENNQEPEINIEQKAEWFTMHFDGAYSKEGVGAGITISTPHLIQEKCFYYKFCFNCTNNMVEYEALLLGLQILKKMQAMKVYIYGYFELVLRQVMGTYQEKHPRMRDYRNLVFDILECFEEYQIFAIPIS